MGYTLGTTIGLELEWHNSLTDIGGIYFVVRTGVATDFSDLTDRIEVIEDIPAGNFNGYEGVFVLRDTGIETTWLFDKTSVFSIT